MTPIEEKAPSARFLFEPLYWMDRAACIGADVGLFYPYARDGGTTRQTQTAKELCESCEVKDECLDWAVRTRQKHGTWGGKTARERDAMRPKKSRKPKKSS